MNKANVIVDNEDGTIVGVLFDQKKALEYINFLSDKYGLKLKSDHNVFRFTYEDPENYSREHIQKMIG